MDMDLHILQERIRRDPLSYQTEFLSQFQHFQAQLTSLELNPSTTSSRLCHVASFIGAVAHCFKLETSKLAVPIADILTHSATILTPEIRLSLVKLLALLRVRGAAKAELVIPLFFRLLGCRDKHLRRVLHGCIVSDIRRIGKNGPGRRELQVFMFKMVREQDEVMVKRGLAVLADLFRKRIWNDAKCANMIAEACFHDNMPVALMAVRFMLNSESRDINGDDDIDEDDENGDDNGSQFCRDGQKAAELWKAYHMTGKKSSKKRKQMERVINRLSRVKSVTSHGAVTERNAGEPALEAMMLINDPQEFAERLFSDIQHRRKKESYENRLVFINLISRLVGMHELLLFNLYSFLQRYLQPAQPEVTKVLAYLTQACHEKVPPDVLHPILRGLADSFVSERSSPPAVAAGINTIRAICARVPLAILDEENENKSGEEQEAPLLEDLVQYKSNKDKGVMMASRSLIALYREVQPGLLHKKDRGRVGAEAVQTGVGGSMKAYGEMKVASGVDGIDLLNEKDDEEEEEMDGEIEDADNVQDGEFGDGSEREEQVKEVGEDEKDGNKDGEERESKRVRFTDQVDGGDEKKEMRIEEMELLSNEDFAKIRERRAAKALGIEVRVTDTTNAVDPDELQGPIKREKQTAQERKLSIMEGREGREKYSSKKGKDKGGGSTNKKKVKSKSNAMVIHKRRKKSKMSRRERQLGKRKRKDYR